MSAPYLATLEDLAAKRRTLGQVITPLAVVAGVDPAPYLDRPPAVTDAEVDAVTEGLRPHRPDLVPPRPLSPAPRRTTEAGQRNIDMVLDALHGGPLSPKAIMQATGINEKTIAHVFRRLLDEGLVTKTGRTHKTKYQLSTR